jgi:hypothetical protein
MAKKWGQKVAKEIKRRGTEGTFTAAAKSGESTQEHVSRVLASGSEASTKQKRKAQFLRNIAHYEHGGPVTETGPAILHEGETIIRSKGVPADKMSKSYHEYWEEIRPSGASNAGTEQFSSSKAATHGHNYPGRAYPEKGTKTGYPAQDTGEVVPKLDMETVTADSME